MKKKFIYFCSGVLATHFIYFIFVFPNIGELPNFLFKILIHNWTLFILVLSLSFSLFINYYFLKPFLDKEIIKKNELEIEERINKQIELYKQNIEDDRLKLLAKIKGQRDQINSLKSQFDRLWNANARRLDRQAERRRKRREGIWKKKQEQKLALAKKQ